MERVKSEEKSELEVRLEQNQKGIKEIERKLNNYRRAIELGADISLVIEPMNALKSEKQLLEETTRDLAARLDNQPKSEAFRFTKEAHDNFMEMIRTFSAGASVDNLRIFLQRFIQKIVVYPDKISIIYIPLLMNTLKDSGPEDLYTVSMVQEVGIEPTRGLSPAGF